MKKPNIDFSKQGMKRFMLHHVEKLILALGLVLLGTFFWLGFSTPKFESESPKGLVSLSQRAHSHIISDASWTEIEKFRQAEADTPDQIKELEGKRLPADKYVYDYLLGTPAKTADTRVDVIPTPAQHLMAYSFPASVLIRSKSGNQVLRKLPLASADEDDERTGRGRGGAGGRGQGPGPGGGFPGGGFPGAPQQEEEEKPKRPRDDGKVKPGEMVLDLHEQEIPGIRPKGAVSSEAAQPYMCNVTVVTAVVPYDAEYTRFKNTFRGARGYDPFRDRPIYQYLQIEKREIVGGEEGDWKDITYQVTQRIPSFYAAPAAEVVDPEFYHDILTNPIPSMTQIDYRDLAVWPPANMPLPAGFEGGPTPMRDVLAYPSDGEDDGADANEQDIFADDELANSGRRQGGAGRPGGRPGAAGGRGGLPGGFGGPPGGYSGGRGGFGGGGRPASNDPDDKPPRFASGMEMYEESSKALTAGPEKPYKLIRFFDIQTVRDESLPKVQAQYRVRLWLSDPNNEIETGIRQLVNAESGLGGRRGAGGGIGTGGPGGGALDGGGPGGAGAPTGVGEKDDEEELVSNAVHVPVSDPMKAPSVRERISKWNEDLKSGKEKLPTIPTQEGPMPIESLKYCIRSDYSKPSNVVTIGGEKRADFFAGKVVPRKTTRIDSNYVEIGEPIANVVAADWDPELGTRLPANREASRSDVLTFNADVHLLHPIDWSVRKVEDAEIKTDAVVVDIMGGTEVRDLSSSRSPIKYNVPGEVLVMTADGDLTVRNDIADKMDYFLTLLQEDEIAEIGGKKKKKDTIDERGGRGRGGRGGGGDRPDF